MTSPLRIAPNDERIERLKASVVEAPTIKKGEYTYFVHPLSDGVPRQSGEMLAEARDLVIEMVNWDEIDIILGIEAMGIPLASCVSIATGVPLVIGRKRHYGLAGEILVDQSTGYSNGAIYINDIQPGERVFVVDDVISTGGTLRAVLKAVEKAGATVQDVICVFEKNNIVSELTEETGWPIRSLVRVTMDGDKVVLLD